ncbi:MAG TPA: hypothetical protein VHT49_00870 [Acidimicrobiales bacterium]|nr:hypothetical protein [Acidimicrobiales bacterium]
MEKTTVSRRAVLGGTAVAAVAAATGGLAGSASATALPAAARTAGQPSLKDFERLLGAPFSVSNGPVLTSVTLDSVTPMTMTGLPRNATAGGVKTTGEQFSLMFSGFASSSFPQDTYRVSARGVGTFDLFIVPVGGPGTKQQYQAIIVNV